MCWTRCAAGDRKPVFVKVTVPSPDCSKWTNLGERMRREVRVQSLAWYHYRRFFFRGRT